MALTDAKRITTSFFSINRPFIDSLAIRINGRDKKISLSSGLNVIIGDNSIGKSLILENLLDEKLKRNKRNKQKRRI